MSAPPSLQEITREALGDSGVIAQHTSTFRIRRGQLDMADAVVQTIEGGGALVVEAGTGTGKTFAYLVPALLSGQRVMVSTATKALQDQLFGRDLPRLLEMLQVPVRVALLKGRANYLCPHRLKLHLQAGAVADRFIQGILRKVQEWYVANPAGDLTLMPGLDARSSAVPLVTSTRENCLGSSCPDFSQCPLQGARKAALGADLVVVNHHLFFADLAVRESGVAELLPTVDVAIFDEAHQLNEIGVMFLGAQIGSGQLLDLSRDALVCGLQHARGLCDWTQRCAALEKATRDLRLTMGSAGYSRRLAFDGAAPQGVSPSDWHAGTHAVDGALADLASDLDSVSELNPDFVRLFERVQGLRQRLRELSADADVDHVKWLDVGKQWRWVNSPLDSAQAFASVSRANIQSEAVEAPQRGPRSWVFTSATLGDTPSLSWFCEPLGLVEAKTLVVDSPFDHGRQAALWVPNDLPAPSDPAHTQSLAASILPWVLELGGRTLFLTTSLRALEAAAQCFRDSLQGTGVVVLAQGEEPKPQLLARFAQPQPHSGAVLVASVSFWEGVDLPGDMLQLVVLDKLPFPVPDDPVGKARARRIEAVGESAFSRHSLPATAVALKQGAGRLIRTETDRGMLVIGDHRLMRSSYGSRLRAALPPMKVLAQREQADEWVRGLVSQLAI